MIMRLLLLAAGAIAVYLQHQLWLGEDGWFALRARREEAAEQLAIIADLRRGNRELEVEVLDLKHGTEAIEARARSELGMIRDGETFHIVID